MRRLSTLIALALFGAATPVYADPHAEMAAALAAQIDAHPLRASVPTSRTQTASLQLGRATTTNTNPAGNERGNSQSNASATGLAHQAQSGAANAAGQAQAAAAKARPHPPHPTH